MYQIYNPSYGNIDQGIQWGQVEIFTENVLENQEKVSKPVMLYWPTGVKRSRTMAEHEIYIRQ